MALLILYLARQEVSEARLTFMRGIFHVHLHFNIRDRNLFLKEQLNNKKCTFSHFRSPVMKRRSGQQPRVFFFFLCFLTVAIKGTSRNLAEITSGLLIKDSKEQLNIYKVD